MNTTANDTITAVPGLLAGHWTDGDAATGCTVVICPQGAVASADVRGGAPGTRETDLLRPGTLVERVHGVLLTGGSAFGLDAAGGVMRWLEERGHGFPTPSGVVPIVVGAVLIDLSVGRSDVRPDAASGYAACAAASKAPPAMGSVGAAEGEVDEDGAGDDGDDAGGDREAAAALLQPAHDAAGGVQAEGAAAAEKDGVDAVDEVAGAEEVGLAGAGGAAAHVGGGDGAVGAEDDCAAGGGLPVGPVTDLEAGDGGNGVAIGSGRHLASV